MCGTRRPPSSRRRVAARDRRGPARHRPPPRRVAHHPRRARRRGRRRRSHRHPPIYHRGGTRMTSSTALARRPGRDGAAAAPGRGRRSRSTSTPTPSTCGGSPRTAATAWSPTARSASTRRSATERAASSRPRSTRRRRASSSCRASPPTAPRVAPLGRAGGRGRRPVRHAAAAEHLPGRRGGGGRALPRGRRGRACRSSPTTTRSTPRSTSTRAARRLHHEGLIVGGEGVHRRLRGVPTRSPSSRRASTSSSGPTT